MQTSENGFGLLGKVPGEDTWSQAPICVPLWEYEKLLQFEMKQ